MKKLYKEIITEKIEHCLSVIRSIDKSKSVPKYLRETKNQLKIIIVVLEEIIKEGEK